MEQSSETKFKQVICVRMDLKMDKGKMLAQGAHASMLALEEAYVLCPDFVLEWRKNGYTKIALKVPNEERFWKDVLMANRFNLPIGVQVDWGLTQLPPNTASAFAIGPYPEIIIDEITGDLSLL
jgi:PTH2 family peptidyl-tRNA hydrolase